MWSKVNADSASDVPLNPAGTAPWSRCVTKIAWVRLSSPSHGTLSPILLQFRQRLIPSWECNDGGGLNGSEYLPPACIISFSTSGLNRCLKWMLQRKHTAGAIFNCWKPEPTSTLTTSPCKLTSKRASLFLLSTKMTGLPIFATVSRLLYLHHSIHVLLILGTRRHLQEWPRESFLRQET